MAKQTPPQYAAHTLTTHEQQHLTFWNEDETKDGQSAKKKNETERMDEGGVLE
tara:strand:+ start:312 stop:470 length:159 start_codon:yes stop_codon:yes gene_type:complete